MVKSLSIHFYLNTHKSNGQKLPLYIRITHKRKKSEIATRYFLETKEWDHNKRRAKKNIKVNEFLANIESQVHDIINRLEKEKKPINSHIIKNYLTQKDKLDAFLVDFYDRFMSRLEKAGELKPDSISRYRETRNHIADFLQIKKLDDVLIENVDYKFITDFDLYLINKRITNQPRLLERNTVNKHHSRLKSVLIKAIREGYIYKNPYHDFKLKNTPSKRTFLSQEELDKIIRHPLGGNISLQRVKDIFIFSVYTGLRFEDAQQLTTDHIEKNKDGKYSLVLHQEKTKEPLHIPLLPPALNIIKKYEKSPEREVFKKLLPKISNQKTNIFLKVISDMVGLKKKLTHHVARHTCATTILMSNDVPIEAVSKWLGHTNIKTTQIYAKITNTYLHKIASRIKT